MSTNLYTRLRALLPAPPVLLARVLAINGDGTSTLQVPGGTATAPLSPEVSTGATFTARGTSVPVGALAVVRSGAIESQAPDGLLVDHTVGVIAPLPDGPPALALTVPLVAPAATVGVAYTFDVSGAWTGGYSPRIYSLASGTLPAGLALAAATGVLSGTPTAAGSASLVLRATDSTRRAVDAAAFALVVT